jgi:lambda repressor-like predicted transcriptional regulator
MHPEDIKASVRKNGHTLSRIAQSVSRTGVTKGAVSRVVHGSVKSRAIALAISKATGLPVSTLWPGKYPDLEKLDLMARGRAAIAKQIEADRAAHAAKTSKRRAA